ncbi:MAG: DUF3048 domain-containing protein [Chloroflexota bacterium]
MFRKFTLAVCLLALLAACNGQSATPTSTVAPTQLPTETPYPAATATLEKETANLAPTATRGPTGTPIPTLPPQDVGPDNFPADANPLTGLIVTDTALLERRPVSVKVNIVPRGTTRPAWGLSQADIVYDYYHNDGYARFHAIFYGTDVPLVGPVRSGRLPDVELVRMYKSIFAYGSADQRINSRLFNSEFSNRLVLESGESNCPPTNENPLCRYDPNGYKHLLGGTNAIRAYAVSHGSDNVRQNLNGMLFGVAQPSSGAAGSQVITYYSIDNYLKWEYDPASGRYLRFQDAVTVSGPGNEVYEPLLDRLTDKQIAADNVVVLVVPHTYFAPPPGDIVEILLSGVGKAYAFRDGQAYEVTWNRPTVDSVLYLTFADGTRYPFKPGNTWFQVVSTNSKVAQPGDGLWRYDFVMP